MSQAPIPNFRRKALISAMICASWPAAALAQESDTIALDPIEVSAERGIPSSESTNSYAPTSNRTSLKMDLSHRETPQSVSVITHEQMEDFGLNDVNDVLEGTTGVTVESVETDRTYYTARGFDITNFQYDGVRRPNVYDNVQGDMDTFFYDRVEVLRGANGLVTGTGNPSAIVNFIRKRPTAETQAEVAVTGGSYENKRIVGDLSGSLTESGNVRGRILGGYQDQESYLDRFSREKELFSAVVEADLTANTLLTLGHATQSSDADSPLWGALPLLYSDGTQASYDRSTSTSADWSYWNNTQHNSFVELQQLLAAGWQLKGTVMRLEQDSDSELFYQYGAPDPQTGEGLFAYPSQYELNTQQWVVDAHATGPFDLAGRTHELVVGTSWSRSETVDESNYGQGIGTPLPPLEEWTGDYPKPAFTAGVGGSDWTDKEINAYAAARWTVTDRLTAITGAGVTWVDSDGVSYGASKNTRYDAEPAPYVGLIYDVTDNHSVYASYTRIFTPQTEQDINRDRLDPIEGNNYEVGVKGEYFGGGLVSTLAVFRTEQDNVAEIAGTYGNSADNYYTGMDGITSEGVELELAGEVVDGVKVYAGYAFVDIDDADGETAKPYVPEHKVNLRGAWQVPGVAGLELGSQIRWQSEISRDDKAIKQDSYTLVDLMASYDFARNWNATVNVNNVTNEKYIESLQWAQGFYGAPTQADLKITWTY